MDRAPISAVTRRDFLKLAAAAGAVIATTAARAGDTQRQTLDPPQGPPLRPLTTDEAPPDHSLLIGVL